jgi:hypothetical protein
MLFKGDDAFAPGLVVQFYRTNSTVFISSQTAQQTRQDRSAVE